MYYSYQRVSAIDQNLDRQTIAIREYCNSIGIDYDKDVITFYDKKSGKNLDRKGYMQLKEQIKSGDTLIIKEMDRLSRNKIDLKNELDYFKRNNIKVRILNLPTTLQDSEGQEWITDMVNNVLIEVLSSVAEEERLKIKQRQMEGIKAYIKKNGRWAGRERTYSLEDIAPFWEDWINDKIKTVDIANKLQIGTTATLKLLKEYTAHMNYPLISKGKERSRTIKKPKQYIIDEFENWKLRKKTAYQIAKEYGENARTTSYRLNMYNEMITNMRNSAINEI